MDDSGDVYAAKTVAKTSVMSEKNRSKLLAEIKIHKGLDHPNIVKFVDCFEDDTNVYILLEICSNNSLMNMLKTRVYFTEPECRFFLTQIIGAISYMHDFSVIHRDLKLGNIFLDEHMNVKIGDFGLAARLNDKSERKKTMCGTPNYIAPEVLDGKEQGGHSYEVDIWSIGIILYAMLYSKPPFQSKNVELIYEKIKATSYAFPDTPEHSDGAKDLISSILVYEPERRPSLEQILSHRFFKTDFPKCLDSSVLTEAPTQFYNMSPKEAEINFNNCKIKAKLAVPSSNSHNRIKSLVMGKSSSDPLEPIDEKHSGPGILPTSLSPASTKEKYKMVMMVKKSNSGKLERGKSGSTLGSSNGKSKLYEQKTDQYDIMPVDNENEDAEVKRSEALKEENLARRAHENNAAATAKQSNSITTNFAPYNQVPDPQSIFHTGLSLIKSLINAQEQGREEYIIQQRYNIQPPSLTYVTQWVDYSNRYGIGYMLSNSYSGLLMSDSVTILLNHNSDSGEIVRYSQSEGAIVTQNVKQIHNAPLPSQYVKRFKLAHTLHNYMNENLRSCGNIDSPCVNCRYRFERGSRSQNGQAERAVYLLNCEKRGGSFFSFQFSNGDLQVNFSDHTKFVFQSNGEGVFFIHSDNIHYLNLRNGHVCCESWYAELTNNTNLLMMVQEKMMILKNEF